MKLKSDNVGKVFGTLKVVKALTYDYQGKRMYQCQCVICKQKVLRHKGQLKEGRNCKCGKTSCAQEYLKGKKFGKLTAVNFITTKNGSSLWMFKCDCGNLCEKSMTSVKGNRTSLCCKECMK